MRSILRKNKKGAEMTIGTIIIIVLALVVLVILVYGFSTGWSNLWEKITAFGGGKVNVQSVVQSCQLACTTGSRYDYCELSRTVTFDEKKTNPDNRDGWKCAQLQYKNTGLECPAINCGGPVSMDLTKLNNPTGLCTELNGEWNEKLKVCEKRSVGETPTEEERCAGVSTPTEAKCTSANCKLDTAKNKCVPK